VLGEVAGVLVMGRKMLTVSPPSSAFAGREAGKSSGAKREVTRGAGLFLEFEEQQ
jgi:hypothetical protein